MLNPKTILGRATVLAAICGTYFFAGLQTARADVNIDRISAHLVFQNSGFLSAELHGDTPLWNTIIGEGFASGGGPSGQTLIKIRFRGQPNSFPTGEVVIRQPYPALVATLSKEELNALVAASERADSIVGMSQDFSTPQEWARAVARLTPDKRRLLDEALEIKNRMIQKEKINALQGIKTNYRQTQTIGLPSIGPDGFGFILYVASGTGCETLNIEATIVGQSRTSKLLIPMECGE